MDFRSASTPFSRCSYSNGAVAVSGLGVSRLSGMAVIRLEEFRTVGRWKGSAESSRTRATGGKCGFVDVTVGLGGAGPIEAQGHGVPLHGQPVGRTALQGKGAPQRGRQIGYVQRVEHE